MNILLKLELKEWHRMVASQELPKGGFHWSKPDGSRQKRYYYSDV
ncbi:Uncharacterized protein XB16_2895 [Leptospira santarosai]|uniref:Uncharacterized protein n=1 Tax=Leptospira santarosai TaxID=28183 RepID=A0A2P1QWB4_9LEPT|nr:Uncharacterized protein XB16_2895 [Leptospira santarosai]